MEFVPNEMARLEKPQMTLRSIIEGLQRSYMDFPIRTYISLGPVETRKSLRRFVVITCRDLKRKLMNSLET